MSVNGVMTWETDVSKPLRRVRLGTLAADDQHEVTYCIRVMRDGEPLDVSAAAAVCTLVRADRTTVPWNAVTTGSEIRLSLPRAAHAVPGSILLAVSLVMEDVTNTVLLAEGNVLAASTQALVDPGSVVPDISDLLAQIEQMQRATSAANAAAARVPVFSVDARGDVTIAL